MLRKRQRIGFVIIILLLAGGFLQCNRSRGSIPDHPVIWIIGLDGATWQLIQPLLDKGELPHLKKLQETSAWGTLETLAPTISPVLWTTMATGLPLEYHGVTSWKKGQRLITSGWRHGVPFWEIADRSDYRPAVINWWATYPATRLINGWMVSDRFRNGIHRREISRLPGMTYPPQLADDLDRFFSYIDGSITNRLMKDYGFPIPAEAVKQWNALFQKPLNLKRLRSLPGYVRQDLIVEAITEEILDRFHPDFLAVLLRIIDVYSHLVFSITPADPLFERAQTQYPLDVQIQMIENGTWTSVETRLNRAFAFYIKPALKMVDDLVGRLLARRPPNSYLIIVSDHGFRWSGEHLFDHQAYSGIPLAHGMFLVNGPGVRPGHQTQPMTLYQIAPLVIGLMRAPLSKELKGNFPYFLFKNEGFWKHSLRFVPSYRRIHHEVTVDEKSLKKTENPLREDLKTLGYIQ